MAAITQAPLPTSAEDFGNTTQAHTQKPTLISADPCDWPIGANTNACAKRFFMKRKLKDCLKPTKRPWLNCMKIN